MITKSIIDLGPRVSWCQVLMVLIDTPMLGHGVCYEQTVTCKSKKNTPIRFRSGRLFLPITPFQVSLSLTMWALKSPLKSPSKTLSYFIAPNPETSRRLVTLNCHSAHKQKWQSEPSPWPKCTWRPHTCPLGNTPTFEGTNWESILYYE